MSVADPTIDPEIASEMKAILAEHVDKKFSDFEGKVERRMKELSARGPGVSLSGASGTRALPLLGGDQKFSDWLRQGRGLMTRFAANYAGFRIEQKATILSPALHAPVPGISGPPEMALRLVELLPVVNLTSGGSVEYAQETGFTPGADIQLLEGDVKAVTDITFGAKTTAIKTIATILKASLQALADTPGLYSWLDARLRYAVQLKAEDWLLNAAAPDGLMAVAGATDPAFAAGTGATALDILGAAIAQLQASGYTVDGVVMSGSDVNKMRLLKNSVGDYLWARPSSSLGTASVWTVPLVISPSMPAGSWLVGAFAQSTVLYSRQMLVVDIAFENEDDFIRNLAALRAEERIGLAIPIPTGLLKGTFTPPAALAVNRK